MQAESGAGRQKSICLESCRGLCAIIVALLHLGAGGYYRDLPIIRNAHLGVTYFFVLSGFVIMHAYGDTLRDRRDLLPFMLRRFGRLYPLHLAVLLFLVALEALKLVLISGGVPAAGDPPFTHASSFAALIGNLLLINGLGFFNDYTWNAPSWTISTEIWVYLLFFIVIMARRWFRLAAIALILTTGTWLFANNIGLFRVPQIEGAGAISCIYCFFIGAVAYPIARYNLPAIKSTTGEIMVVLLVGLAFWDAVPVPDAVDPLIFAAAIIVLSGEAGAVSRALKARVLTYLGTISYSIYLLHFTILSLMVGALRVVQTKLGMELFLLTPPTPGAYLSPGEKLNMDMFAALYLGLIIFAAHCTYAWIEVPCRRYFNARAQRLQQDRAPG